MSRALKGNKRAWLALIKKYEKQVYNYGLRMTGNTEDAADLMQEIFISLFKSLSSYRHEGSFRGWLFRIAHFRCVEFYRRKRPEQNIDDEPPIHCESNGPSEQLNDIQQSAQVIAAMQALPISQRFIVEQKFFGQFTFEEIAEQTGISTNTVKSRLYAALGKMRPLLEVDYE